MTEANSDLILMKSEHTQDDTSSSISDDQNSYIFTGKVVRTLNPNRPLQHPDAYAVQTADAIEFPKENGLITRLDRQPLRLIGNKEIDNNTTLQTDRRRCMECKVIIAEVLTEEQHRDIIYNKKAGKIIRFGCSDTWCDSCGDEIDAKYLKKSA